MVYVQPSNYYVSTATNYFTNMWSNCPVVNVEYVHHSLNATYDRRADVLSVTIREGESKYVVVGRGTFVVFADDNGVWSVDLEAEEWNRDVESVFRLVKVEIF